MVNLIVESCKFASVEESYDVWFKDGLAAYRLCVSIYDMKMLAEETALCPSRYGGFGGRAFH